MNKEQIGLFVRNERKKQKLSQVQLAEKAGLSRYQQVLEIEKAQFNYGVDGLIMVLNALKIPFPLVNDSEVIITKDSKELFDFTNVESAKEPKLDKPIKSSKKVTPIFKRQKQK